MSFSEEQATEPLSQSCVDAAEGMDAIGAAFLEALGAELSPDELEAEALAALSRKLPQPVQVRDIEGTLQGREFVFRDSYASRVYSLLSARGGIGKSTIALLEIVSMAVGRDLLACGRYGVEFAPETPLGPIPVLYISLEDDLNEFKLRLRAIFIEYQFSSKYRNLACDNLRFLFDDEGVLRVATKSAKGVEQQRHIEEHVTDCITQHGAKAVVIDPLIGFHAVGEGEEIQAVAEALRRIAKRCNCAIKVVTHSRKGGFNDSDSTRGHSSLRDAARHQAMASRPDKKTLSQMGVSIADQDNIISVSQGKANLSQSARDEYYVLRAVPVPVVLHGKESTQWVATVRPYSPPGIYSQFDMLQIEAIRAIPAVLKPNSCRENIQADNWIGYLIKDLLVYTDRSTSELQSDEPSNDTIKHLVGDLLGKRGCWRKCKPQINSKPVPVVEVHPEKLADLTTQGIQTALEWAIQSPYAALVDPEAANQLMRANCGSDAEE